MTDLRRQVFEIKFEGKSLRLEISKIASQANASVIGRFGDTVVLSTVVVSRNLGISSFLPLSVEFKEKYYAAGKIGGSRFIRREGKPPDQAILSARVIDRTIRPLFDQRIRQPIQVVNTIFSYDQSCDPVFIALLSTSLALCLSGIPFKGPVAGVRYINKESQIDAFFAGTETRIDMIEFEGKEVKIQSLVELFKESQNKIRELVKFQKDIIDRVGKKQVEIFIDEPPEKLKTEVLSFLEPRLEKATYQEGRHAIGRLKEELFEYLKNGGFLMDEKYTNWTDRLFEEQLDELVHQKIIFEQKRPDQRKLEELRPLYAEVGTLPRTHGSALFVRGETQSLSIVTLASPGQEKLVDTMEASKKERFFHHYNFPGYCVGEVGREGPPSRREIGHGILVEKALRKIIPPLEVCPYTIRVVSEILSSNGSSSMASVCSSCLALMDAGVKISKPMAGIAMGLMIDRQLKNYRILTDIQGPEDHHGDMDLKVVATADGICALQMDTKIEGINYEIFENALKQASLAHQQILELFKKVLPAPREEYSPYTLKVDYFKVNPQKIGLIIGSGGRTIQQIVAEAGEGTDIVIEPDGKVFISAPTQKQIEKAESKIQAIVKEYKVGELVEGKVSKVLSSGAIVDLNGTEAFLHISELGRGYIRNIKDVLKVGQNIVAKVIKVEGGKIFLSLK